MSDDTKPDLEAALDHYGVPLKVGRVSYMTRCPFHEDRTPSLSVNTDKQLWRCHSCGKSGDSITLIMEKEGTDYLGSRTVAATLGLADSDAGGGDAEVRGSRYGSRRSVPAGKRDRPDGGGYVPAWRRR